MTKEEAVQFLYQIADEIQSLLDKRPSPKGQWTSQKRLEALSVAISALRDLSQAEQDGRIFPCKPDDLGKTWFLTREEARAVIEAQRGDKSNDQL